MKTGRKVNVEENYIFDHEKNSKAFYVFISVYCGLSWILSILGIPILSEAISRNWLLFIVFMTIPLSKNMKFSLFIKILNYLTIASALIFHAYLSYSVLGFKPDDPAPVQMMFFTFAGYFFIAFSSSIAARKIYSGFELF